MATTVRQVKAQAHDLLQRVQEQQQPIEITCRGEVVARLSPARQVYVRAEELAKIWEQRQRLSAAIGAHWPADVTAIDAVRDVRRDP